MKKILVLLSLISVSVSASFYSNATRFKPSQLDVIVLLDNSGSMTRFAKVSDMVRTILENVNHNDINIGLITNGPLEGRPLFRTTPVRGTMEEVLDGLEQDMKMFDFQGPASETFYDSLLKTTETHYNEFYRKGADIKFIVITDEDEDPGVPGGLNTFKFINILKGRLNIGHLSMDLIVPAGECRNQYQGKLEDMVLYESLQILGGRLYNLCDVK